MEGREVRAAQPRTIVYCVVPVDLAPKLHELLRRHFRADPAIEVVVESRSHERRSGVERRVAAPDARRILASEERRVIRSVSGRRVADRRAASVRVDGPPLPRKARPYRERLAFVELIAPAGQELEDLDTARLVTRIQAGDRDGFALLYMRYFDRVYSYLNILLGDPHAAEDAAQQVFLQLLQALPGYERRRQPFRAWLFVIVRNLALKQLRKSGRLEVVDPVELNRRRELSVDDSDLRALEWVSDRDLTLLVERLPLAQRQVLMLRFMLGLQHREIASVLGRSETDVTVLQSRALRFLRERLTALGRAPEHGRRSRMTNRAQKAHVLRRRRFALLS
jgi:RNA polymerase sigma-70 factor (ECF subfamily)